MRRKTTNTGSSAKGAKRAARRERSGNAGLQIAGLAILLLGLCRGGSWAGETGNAPDEPGADKAVKVPAKKKADTPEAPTRIVAETLRYDIVKRVVVFNGNVHVTDDQVDLKADKVTIYFDAESNFTRIIAIGNVTAKNEGDRATGGHAEYDRKTKVLTLSGNPVLITGDVRIEGAEKIIYYGKERQFKTVGGKPRTTVIRQELDKVKKPRARLSGGNDVKKQKPPLK